MYDAAGQGSIIGVTPNHLVAFGDCTGLPCSVIAIDRASGATKTLAGEAWSASLAGDVADAGTVRIETAAGVIEVDQ
jgi:hypothetical protein